MLLKNFSFFSLLICFVKFSFFVCYHFGGYICSSHHHHHLLHRRRPHHPHQARMDMAVTKEMILDNKSIQQNRNTTATVYTACGRSYQNFSHVISILLDCFVINDYFLSNRFSMSYSDVYGGSGGVILVL